MYSKVVFLFALLSVDAAPNVYDQSQNGELNIQVDLKDLQIFALLKGQHEEYYEDIDYAYDYSEMTIKPQSTSKNPLNVTTPDISTESVTESTTKSELNTSLNPLNVTSTGFSTEMTTKPALNTAQNILNVTYISSSTDSEIQVTVKPSRKISQNPLNITAIDTSLDNVTDITIKPQVSTLTDIMNVTTSRTSTYEYITEATTVSTKNNTEEHDGMFSFFSRLFEPFSSTISNTSSFLKLQSREDNGATTTNQKNMEATKNTKSSDAVIRKQQSEISHNLPVKNEIEYTTKMVDTIGSNVPTKITTNSNCKKGYITNQKGRCVMKMPLLSNTLLKIVKLAQKLKPRRQRNGQDTL